MDARSRSPAGSERAVVPVVAGSAGLSYRRLLVWDIPSTAAWTTTMVAIGYAWGDDVADAVDRIGIAISALALVVIGVLFWRWRRSRGKRRAMS